MLKDILPRIPNHHLYCEPFCGGAAVFWSKAPSKVEVLNYASRIVVNFYEQLQNNFDALATMIRATLHSRSLHDDAWVMYNNPHLFTEVQLAWAFWILTNQGFSGMISNTWTTTNGDSKDAKSNKNKKAAFAKELSERLELVQLECRDALRIIINRDREDTFFYVDPPYINSNQGHYGGYTASDFESLLSSLANIKGKFLLSSYPSALLEHFTKANGWHQLAFDKALTAGKTGRRKTEVLTANYEI